MDHAAGVGVGHRLADCLEDGEEAREVVMARTETFGRRESGVGRSCANIGSRMVAGAANRRVSPATDGIAFGQQRGQRPPLDQLHGEDRDAGRRRSPRS